MKVHNYGSDYAYQRHQKKEVNQCLDVKPETIPTDNVEDQLPAGGETTVAAAYIEAISESNHEKAPETKKRKKKEKAVDSE